MSKLRIFSNGLDHWRDELTLTLEAQLEALGSASDLITVSEDDGSALEEHELVLFLVDDEEIKKTLDAATEQRLREHLEAGGQVIPVLDELGGASQKLPTVLQDYNAYAVGTAKPRRYDRLVDEVLTRLWWRRRDRRLFLSYKRSDSSGVAHQLRDELTRRGFQVFLDECTLTPGAAVQREIMSALTDSDFVLLLCSPNLGDSQWVMDEIAAANTILVPILGVIWPAITPPSALFSDEVHPLSTGAFDGRKAVDQVLTPTVLDSLLSTIESYRARGIYRRLENLLPYFRAGIAPRFAVKDADELGDIEIDDTPPNGNAFVRVLPFRPTVNELHDLNHHLQARLSVPDKAYIFYAENDPDDPARRALEWALEPDRTKPPNRFRLLSLIDGRTDLGDLA